MQTPHQVICSHQPEQSEANAEILVSQKSLKRCPNGALNPSTDKSPFFFLMEMNRF